MIRGSFFAKRFRGFKPRFIPFVLFMGITLALMCFVVNWMVSSLFEARYSVQNMPLAGKGFPLWQLILVSVLVPAVFEELFFRCTLFGNVRSYGTSSMIIACGFTFGIWHANYPQFLMAAVMGICSCFLLEKTGSVFPSMIVHFIFNSIGATMSVLLSSTGILQGDPMTQSEEMTAQLMENPLICIAILLMCLMVIVILVVWLVFMIIEITDHRESFCIEKKKTELSEKKKFALYMTQPFMLIVMLFMLGLTIYRALGGEM
jgi:membrane protease YdiL (CAAX protease family)